MSAPIMRMPRSLDLEITARCNLRCRYCYFFFDNPATLRADLPISAWLRFFEELNALGVLTVFLTGGEPLLREDLPTLIQGLVQNRLRYEIATNGMLIDDERAEFIARTRRCNFVQVSLDGARAETHDSARGVGAFAGAVRGIEILQRQGIKVIGKITLHRGNFDDLENTARLLLDELRVAQIAINAAGYFGAARNHADRTLLTAPEYAAVMDVATRLAREYGERVAVRKSNLLIQAQVWQAMENARATDFSTCPNSGYLTGCGCPTHKLTVRPDGVMIPCSLLPHIELGQINHDALTQVWQTSAGLTRLRARRKIPLTRFAACATCGFVAACTGGCPGGAYHRTGEIDAPNPDACLSQFREQGKQ